MCSVPDRTGSEKHCLTYPRFHQIEFDDRRLIIRILNPQEGKRDYFLMAPSREILEAVISKMEIIMEKCAQDEGVEVTNEPMKDPSGNADPYESMIEFPEDDGIEQVILFVALFPFRLLMHWTLPDVRVTDSAGNAESSLAKAYCAIVMCLFWLIVGSYAMVASLEGLAELLDIPDAIIGVTVSAAGTSLPNYIASKIAAEEGFGNMAVSNAFGSNTFNIMIGLGLPWVLYTCFGTGFEPYHGLRDEGITENVLILGSVLLVFIAIVLTSGFVLHRWHGKLFIALYVSYIFYEILRVYV